ncbi:MULTISPECIES: TRAP transporter substrate-binding protein [unclassified Aurantimonas]|uniref:TRAP transporter substrate-binding protein n=1 Tax=unclassified Aurantimonas TaxID=2638230 RepID=UPI002E173581|nr:MULTISPECIES: TRAP transporter substrate-binding protein [unclassified Aurantimonas]MEC5293481.1 TRAP transporter substrate-binding protein [Aurantimonas sp. C2-3-R2]MEC5414554.1 TRAP transporter substrate-binding protein [Aurantimonas sp. C2-4-R8]
MNKLRSGFFGLCAAAAIGLLSAETAVAAEFTLKAGHDQPVGSTYDVLHKKFAELVEERTNGRVEIKVYPAAQLGSELELAQGLRLGTLDFSTSSVGNVNPLLPKAGLLGAPYIIESLEHRKRLTANDGLFYKALEKAVNESGVGIKLLGITTAGVRSVYNSERPIYTPDDLVDMKIRTMTSDIQVEGWQNLGAVPTPIAFAELYSALQTGVVDAGENSPEFYFSMKHYEQAPYYSLTEHMVATGLFMMNNSTWDKLPEDIQAIIVQAAAEATAFEREFDLAMEEEYMNDLLINGAKVNLVYKQPFIELARPLHEEIAERVGATELLQIIQDEAKAAVSQ